MRLARLLFRKFRKQFRICRARIAQVSGAQIHTSAKLSGRVTFSLYKQSSIRVCENVVLNSRADRNTLEARGPVLIRTILPNASIFIGRDSGITSSTISSARSIQIGERVLIGAGSLITDSDHHVVQPLNGSSRRYMGLPEPKPSDGVVIEDDVFIGARSIILKGVRIGTGAVIGAGSVVTRDIPPFHIAAGNPCVIVKAMRT